MSVENTPKIEFEVPEIIADGKAFAYISSFRGMRKEVFRICINSLNIRFKENTYLKYFLNPTNPKKGGIPNNQNFQIICDTMEYALTEVLMSILTSTDKERRKLLTVWWAKRNEKKEIIESINEILRPYTQNIKKNETIQRAVSTKQV